jgi:adenylosuccinate lyase
MFDEIYDYTTYLSPLTWRYGSKPMRQIWSEEHKRRLWRKIWVALAQAQFEFGLVSKDQLDDLYQHENDIDIPAALKLESEIHHDLTAELKVFASQCPFGGGIIHLGATSMDIEDNADALRLKQALSMLMHELGQVLSILAEKIDQFADQPVIGFTHLQAAAPTTLGYRLAFYAQDLLNDWKVINQRFNGIMGKGFKGATGTSATYINLIGIEHLKEFEERLSQLLELDFFSVSGQTYPRKQDYEVLCAIAGVGASLNKFAFDLRFLQSTSIGSSAMPFKRNPVQAEKINSLARLLAQMPRVAWDNAANSLLERTLDDNANRRSLLAESCLICDELLMITQEILSGLKVDLNAIQHNLHIYMPFAASEQVMIALVKRGADRQVVHEQIRLHSIKAWKLIQAGEKNPLETYITGDESFLKFIPSQELQQLMQNPPDIGNAPFAARQLVSQIKEMVSDFE